MRRLAWSIGLWWAVSAMGSITRTAHADEPPAVLDADDLCGSVPAVSADSRLVALTRCRSDLSEAHETTFELVRRRDGRVVRRIPISSASTGGEDPTPERLVARAVRLANRVLTRGRFRPMVAMVDERGNAERLERGAGDGLLLTYDPVNRQVVVADTGTGRVRAATALAPHSAHPYCCGHDEDEWQSATCVLTPVIAGAWADSDANVVAIHVAAYDGPDGCEEGPDWLVLALSP
jgi:hypothetical protein